MRGKVLSGDYSEIDYRITTAYAGKSALTACRQAQQPDHPRLCGEKCNALCKPDCTTGSPPPMRGKGHFSLKISSCMRITPAYAGKSGRSYNLVPSGQDHPRLCGEKCQRLRLYQRHQGSPPPMRGKADVVLNRIDRIGITPAYAGKRYSSSNSLSGS